MPEKGICFQRYVKYKAKCGRNFGGGEKQIRFRGKVEGMEAGVLVAKGNAAHMVRQAHHERVGELGAVLGSAWVKGIGR